MITVARAAQKRAEVVLHGLLRRAARGTARYHSTRSAVRDEYQRAVMTACTSHGFWYICTALYVSADHLQQGPAARGAVGI